MDEERPSKRVKFDEPAQEPSLTSTHINMDGTDVEGDSGISLTYENLSVGLRTDPKLIYAEQLRSEEQEQEQAQEDTPEEMSGDEPDTIDRLAPRPMSEVRSWIYSAANREQQRARFTAFAHSLWPSNDEFTSARHPFYDRRDYDRYSDFVRWELYDGYSPYDDDNYDPTTDPRRSTEIWQPNIGDEAIENEEDLRVILNARAGHRARVADFRERRNRFMTAQRNAGVRYEDMDMTELLFVNIESSDEEDSDGEDDLNNGEDKKIKNTTTKVKVETGPSIAAPAPAVAPTTPMEIGQIPVARGRGRPRGSKKKKKGKRRLNKRKRNTDDDEYRYKSDDIDENEPARKRSYKKRKIATATSTAATATTADATTGDVEWRAQTRAAARRRGHGGDGAVDADDDIDVDEFSDGESTGSTSDSDLGAADPDLTSDSGSSSGSGSDSDFSSNDNNNDPYRVRDWYHLSTQEEYDEEIATIEREEPEMRRTNLAFMRRWLSYMTS